MNACTTLISAALLFLQPLIIKAQTKYEYAQVHIVKAGINDKSALHYNFGIKLDSVKHYESFKLKNIIDGIELMESKGWELLNITDYGVYAGVVTTTANFRRKKIK